MTLNIGNPNELNLIATKIEYKKSKFSKILRTQQNICDFDKPLVQKFNDLNKIFGKNECLHKTGVNNSENYRTCKIFIPENSEKNSTKAMKIS
jgi:hypothetical protein